MVFGLFIEKRNRANSWIWDLVFAFCLLAKITKKHKTIKYFTIGSWGMESDDYSVKCVFLEEDIPDYLVVNFNRHLKRCNNIQYGSTDFQFLLGQEPRIQKWLQFTFRQYNKLLPKAWQMRKPDFFSTTLIHLIIVFSLPFLFKR